MFINEIIVIKVFTFHMIIIPNNNNTNITNNKYIVQMLFKFLNL